MNDHITILCVEDEEDVIEATVWLLGRRFSNVHTARNGVEGLKRIDELKPDVIITDLLMPEMDGFEMIKQLRLTDTTTPVVVVTASHEESYVSEVKKFDIQGYLSKPVKKQDLIDALRAVLPTADI